MFLIILLLSIGCIVRGNQYSFSYEELDTSYGEVPVHVEKMETVTIYSTTWKIVTSIDLSLYDNEYQQLRNVVQKMFAVCRVMINIDTYNLYALSTSCTESVEQLENIVNEMENTWKRHVVPAMTKLRRNNSNFQPFLSTFDEIVKNSSATHNFTSFIDGNVETFRSDQIKELNIEVEVINRKINTVKELSKRYFSSKELKSSLMKQFLQELLSYATTTLVNYKVNQRNVYDILLSGNVLSFTTLQRELTKLKDVLNAKNLNLPFNIDDGLSTTLYEYVHIQSTLINRQLFFVYILPIVELTQFESYQFQPYPRKIGGSLFQVLLPEMKGVAVNRQHKKYFDMDYINLENCYRSENYILLCELNQPILSTENSGSCTVELLTHREATHCNFRIMDVNHEIWIQLQQANSWLFVFPSVSEVSIDCNGLIDQRFLTGAGILSIHSMCLIKTENMEIVTYGKDAQTREKVNLAAQPTNDWKEIVHAVTVMNKKITRYSVPKFISKYSVKLFEKFSMSIDEIVVDTRTDLKFKTRTESDSEDKDYESETLKANILNGNHNFKLYLINAIISLVMSLIALIVANLLNRCCAKRKRIIRNVRYAPQNRDHVDDDDNNS